MSEGFKKSSSYSDEWYTPKFIIDSLGKFDLDPCAPSVPLFKTAEVMYNEFDDGLAQNWEGACMAQPAVFPPADKQVHAPYGRAQQGYSPDFFKDRHGTISHGSVQQSDRR